MYCAYVNYIYVIGVWCASMSPDLLSAHGSAALILLPLQCLLTHTHTHLVYSPVSSLRNCRLVLSTFKPSCCPVLLSQLPLSPRQRDAGKKEAGAPFGYGRAICFLLIRSRGTAAQQAGTAEHGKQQRSHAVLCCLLWPVLWVLRALTQAAGWHHGMHSAIQGWCSPVRYVLRS